MINDHVLVAGEPAAVLLDLFLDMKDDMAPWVDGMTRIETRMPNARMGVLLRALMRVEAELLLADADQVDASAVEPRTAEQRRADAFVALALRVADAQAES